MSFIHSVVHILLHQGELPGEPSRYVIKDVSEQYWGLEVDIELDETIEVEPDLIDDSSVYL